MAKLTGGGRHTCALLTRDGAPRWRRADYDQLGYGDTKDFAASATATDVATGDKRWSVIVHVAAARYRGSPWAIGDGALRDRD